MPMQYDLAGVILFALLIPSATSDDASRIRISTADYTHHAQMQAVSSPTRQVVDEHNDTTSERSAAELKRDLRFHIRINHNLRGTLRGCAATASSMLTEIEDLSRENQHQQLSVRRLLSRLHANEACHRS